MILFCGRGSSCFFTRNRHQMTNVKEQIISCHFLFASIPYKVIQSSCSVFEAQHPKEIPNRVLKDQGHEDVAGLSQFCDKIITLSLTS